uniref:GLOBIN domain-containing protein n=1 Tax=Panagrellus redivivus TaxID=6233 RepID=A0A7E4UQH1_PANRE
MLRFYDKYDIQAAIQKLETWLPQNFTTENFFPIVKYAWQNSKESLQAMSGKIFYENAKDLACHRDFGKLEPEFITAVVRAGIVARSEAERYMLPKLDLT